MNDLQKKVLIGSVAAIGTFVVTGFVIGQLIKTKKYYVEIEGVKSDVKVVLLSDLYDCKTDFMRKKILKKLRKINPDLILLAGDINTRKNVYEYFGLLYSIKELAPTYFVKGNNDNKYGNYSSFTNELAVLEIEVLNDESQIIVINGNKFNLIGLSDINTSSLVKQSNIIEEFSKKKEEVFLDNYKPELNNLVVAHRPNYISNLISYENVIGFSGHTQGGVVKLPFLNRALLTSDQGFFANYSYGAYKGNNSLMFVSSGIGKKMCKRFYNQNEIVSITIHGK